MLLVAKYVALLIIGFFSFNVNAKDIYILVVGQSISANCNEYLFGSIPGVNQIDLNGQKKIATDPFDWGDCKKGSMWIPLGKKIIDTKIADSVTFMPIGVQATSVRDWLEGGRAFHKLSQAVDIIKKNDIKFDYVFWHQGSSDIGGSPGEYRKNLMKLLKYIKSNIDVDKIIIAKHSKCGPNADRDISLEQKFVASLHKYHYFPGPDTNLLGDEYRFDECHLNKNGQEKMSELWFHSIIGANNIQYEFDREILINFFR